jgi:hypothetical protein
VFDFQQLQFFSDAYFFEQKKIDIEKSKQVKKAHLRLKEFEIKPISGDPIKNPT